MMITGHGLLNTRVVPFFVTEACPTEAPPPRRLRGFPLPLWRGVNGLANYKEGTGYLKVGPGSPRPVLQQEARLIAPVQRYFALRAFGLKH